MEIKKLTDLPIGELGEENYVVADVDGEVKRISTEDIGGGCLVEGYFYSGEFYEDEDLAIAITPEEGKIYVDLNIDHNGENYRWNGSQYVVVSITNPELPLVLVRIYSSYDPSMTPIDKLGNLEPLRAPGDHSGLSLFDMLQQTAEYIFLAYDAKSQLSVGFDSGYEYGGMPNILLVQHAYFDDGAGGRIRLVLDGGAYVTIDRSNTIEIEGKSYYAWDYVPAPAPTPVDDDLVVNLTGQFTGSHPDVSVDKTAAEIIAAFEAGKNVKIRVNGFDGFLTDIDTDVNSVHCMYCTFWDFEMEFYTMYISEGSSGQTYVNVNKFSITNPM